MSTRASSSACRRFSDSSIVRTSFAVGPGRVDHRGEALTRGLSGRLLAAMRGASGGWADRRRGRKHSAGRGPVNITGGGRMESERAALRGPALVAAARALLAEAPAGLLTDFDGTLAPIVPRPEDARVDAGARRALRRLLGRLALVAVLTGRGAIDARRRVALPGVVYVGEHGLDAAVGRRRWTHPTAVAARPAVSAAITALASRLTRDDVRYEVKQFGLALHYRGAADPDGARAAILDALARSPEVATLRLVEGRQVVELRPTLEASKGTATTCLLRRHALRAALFLGDDRTDLDAMHALHAARAEDGRATLAVAVASPETPPALLAAADGVVEGVPGVAALLAALAG
jgi:trehalose 6-phosphate phosphatase